jgi:hypothetical protein
MEILRRFQADRFVRQLQSGQRVSDSQLTEARTQLLGMGASAVRSLLGATQGGRVSDLALDMLVRLASQDTLSAFVEGCARRSRPADAAARALRAPRRNNPRSCSRSAATTVSRARLEAILEARIHPSSPTRCVCSRTGARRRATAPSAPWQGGSTGILGELLELSAHPSIRMRGPAVGAACRARPR